MDEIKEFDPKLFLQSEIIYNFQRHEKDTIEVGSRMPELPTDNSMGVVHNKGEEK